MQAFAEQGATAAALLHSAWALLLAPRLKLAELSVASEFSDFAFETLNYPPKAHRRWGDVFGAVLSGRNAAVSGVEGDHSCCAALKNAALPALTLDSWQVWLAC